MVKSGKTGPAVDARIEDAIVNGPKLARKDQLSANGNNGQPFSFTESGFHAPINTDLVRAISEEADKMLPPVHIHGCQFRVPNIDGKIPPRI
jgi:blue copper oxidase